MTVFAVYTVIYLLYQAVSLPVNFAGRSFDLTAHKCVVTAWRPGRYPQSTSSCRSAASRSRCCATPGSASSSWCRPTRGRLRVRARRRAERRGGGAGPVVRVRLHAPPDPPRAQEGRQPQLRVPPHPWRAHRHLRRRLPAPRRTSSPRRCRTWTTRPSGSCRPRSSSGSARSRPGSSGRRAPPWRCSTGPCRCRVTGSARRCASAPTPSTGGRRSSRAGGFTVIPYAEDSHTGLDMRYHGYGLLYIPVAARGRDLPGHPRRVHAPAVPLVLRRHLADLDRAHVAGPDAVGRPGCRTWPAGCGTSPPACGR